MIFFPQVPSYLDTAPGSAVPLETFRQPELAPVQTPALHSKGSQKLQPLPKKLRDISFFPGHPSETGRRGLSLPPCIKMRQTLQEPNQQTMMTL